MAESMRPGGWDAEIESDEARFQSHADKLIGGLFVLIKLAMVHRMDNKAVGPATERFHDALHGFQNEVSSDAAIQFVGDAVYINRRLVRAELQTWEKATFLKDFFARMDIGEIAFKDRVPDASVRDFVQAVREVVQDPSKAGEVRHMHFTGIDFRALRARGIEQMDEAALEVPDPVRVLRGYGIIVSTLQELVRLPEHTRPLQLGVLSLEHYRSQIAGRLANIGLMVIMMGRQLGLGVATLRDIGVAAALSGIGRALSAELVFAEPDQCAAYDAFVEGARWLLPSSGPGRAAALRVIAATEQGSAETRRNGHPLSRMVAVAEQYDRWTQRPPRGPGMQADAALRALVDASDLDPAAARLLVSTLGLFPVGSSVKLTTGETAIVVDTTDDPQRLAQPRVMIVADAQGGPVDRRVVELAGSGMAIAGTVDPSQMDLNVGHFLFA